MWQRIVRNTPLWYASTLAGMNKKDNKRPTVDDVARKLEKWAVFCLAVLSSMEAVFQKCHHKEFVTQALYSYTFVVRREL